MTYDDAIYMAEFNKARQEEQLNNNPDITDSESDNIRASIIFLETCIEAFHRLNGLDK